MVKIYVFLSLSFNGYHSLFNFDLTSVCKEQKVFLSKVNIFALKTHLYVYVQSPGGRSKCF